MENSYWPGVSLAFVSGYVAIVRGSVDLACFDWLTVAGDAICNNYVTAKYKICKLTVRTSTVQCSTCNNYCGHMHAFDWSI